MRSLESFLEFTRILWKWDAGDKKSRWVSTQYIWSDHIYTRVSDSLRVPSSAWEFLLLCAAVANEVNEKLRTWGSNVFTAFVMCTMLLTQTSWKGLTFCKCEGKSTWIVGCYNRALFKSCAYYNQVPSKSVSIWILQLVSPPGLRWCYQQTFHRRLLKLFVF